jgi:outer membrane protein TolC
MASVVAPGAPLERVPFQEAVRRASIQAVSNVIAADEIRRAQAVLVQVRASSLPQLFGGATYTYLDGARLTASPTGPITLVAQGTFNSALTASLPVLQPTRWANWSHASDNIDVARANEADVRRLVGLTTARAYLEIVNQKRLLEVSKSSREIAKARFDFAHARRVGGIGNAVDELRAEQQLATTEVQISLTEVNLVRAQEALGVIVGAIGPLDAAEEPDFDVQQGAAGVPEADARRTDVKLARSRTTAAEHVSRDTWVEWLPTLVANAQAFYNDPATVTSPRTGWQVQFVLSLPIFEGFLRVGLKDEREALADESRASLDATLKQVRSDVRVAIEEVRRQEVALAQARLAADRARGALKLVIESYRAGATNDLDVSTAQQQSRDADLAAVIAEDRVRQGRLDLVTAVGQFP